MSNKVVIDLAKEQADYAKALRQCSDVEHPPHYTRGNKEVIVVLQDALTSEEYKGFLKGNIIKYTLRAGYKDDKDKDLAKAKWYIDKLKEVD